MLMTGHKTSAGGRILSRKGRLVPEGAHLTATCHRYDRTKTSAGGRILSRKGRLVPEGATLSVELCLQITYNL